MRPQKKVDVLTLWFQVYAGWSQLQEDRDADAQPGVNKEFFAYIDMHIRAFRWLAMRFFRRHRGPAP